MREKVPSLNWLRVFEVAAQLESFARAAELLDMTTAAVSQQIKALENHYNTTLFKRGARQVTLTDEGNAFLPAVRQALKTVDETATSLFGSTKSQSLTLQSDLIFATSWLIPRLADFDIHFPDVQLHLTGLYHDMDYQRPGAELKIMFGPVHRSWAQCDRLFSETIYAVAHSSIAEQIHQPNDLLNHRLIQIPTHRINWNQMLHSVGIETIPTRQLCFTENTQVALSMAAAGYGIALARKPTTNTLLEQSDIQPIEVCPQLNSSEAYYLVYQNYENLSLASKHFHQWLLKQCSLIESN